MSYAVITAVPKSFYCSFKVDIKGIFYQLFTKVNVPFQFIRPKENSVILDFDLMSQPVFLIRCKRYFSDSPSSNTKLHKFFSNGLFDL